MLQFRKKPIVVEAVRFLQMIKVPGAMPPCIANFYEMPPEWLTEAMRKKIIRYVCTSNALVISTLEGEMIASSGDWIIRGVKGEIYPCKPDVFEATYEPVEPRKDEEVQP